MGNCFDRQQERQNRLSITTSAGAIVVRHGGQKTHLQKKSIVEVIYDYHLEEVRFVTQAAVLRHLMCAATLDELDSLIEDYISDMFIDY